MNKDFKVINMCADTIPLYTENFNVNGVVDYGHDNLFPQFLQELASKSPTHASILNGKKLLIAGNGINRDNLSDDAKVFINNIYGSETLDDIIVKLARDLEMFGGFALNPIWSRDKESIAQLEYIDFATIRKQAPNKNKPTEQKFWVANDWSGFLNNDKVLYPEFSTTNKAKASQILYVIETNLTGENFYATPTYFSTLNSIDIEASLLEFHRNNIKNGFAPSLLIDIIAGQHISEEMKDEIVRGMIKQYAGPAQAGKVMVTFSEDDTKRTSITPIELNSTDERFVEIGKTAKNNIFIGHQVTNPELMGVISDSGSVIASDSDLIRDLAIFNAMYIRPKQIIIERIINKLARINGITDKFILNPMTIDIPIKMTNADIIAILTAAITDEQKIQIFLINGYTREDAENLVINKNKVQ